MVENFARRIAVMMYDLSKSGICYRTEKGGALERREALGSLWRPDECLLAQLASERRGDGAEAPIELLVVPDLL